MCRLRQAVYRDQDGDRNNLSRHQAVIAWAFGIFVFSHRRLHPSCGSNKEPAALITGRRPSLLQRFC